MRECFDPSKPPGGLMFLFNGGNKVFGYHGFCPSTPIQKAPDISKPTGQAQVFSQEHGSEP